VDNSFDFNFINIFWEKKSLDSIGIKKITKTDIIWGFVVLIILVLLSFATEPLVKFLNLQSQNIEIAHVLMLPYILRIFLVMTAGITEEIIFRGYLIERINFLTNHLLFSAIISYLAFIIFHIPFWGIGGAIQIAVWAIPITILYVRRRNLTTCIIIHLLYDGAILIPMLYGY
jgi:membrane protease YdiL (CAAX protease family)